MFMIRPELIDFHQQRNQSMEIAHMVEGANDVMAQANAQLIDAYSAIEDANERALTSARLDKAIQLGNEAVEEALEIAGTDPLTGLLNRRGFDKEISHLLDAYSAPSKEDHAQRHQDTQPRVRDAKHSVVALDLDNFKGVNDVYGHDAGDNVLKRVAEILKNSSRETDVIARLGGEEIILLLPRTDEEHAVEYAEKIRKELTGDPTLNQCVKNERNVTGSFGVYEINPEDTLDSGQILKNADEAMYQAKKNGRNNTVKYSDVPNSEAA